MAKKILRTVGLVGGLVGSAIGNTVGGLIGGKKKKAAEPQKGPVVMPMADDEAVRRAKRRSLIEQTSRGGRQGTMLSSDSDTLGG